MFNPAPQRVAPPMWAPNTVLQPVRQGDVEFANTDWDQVPRLDYRTEKFRQLAVPDPARVVEDASGFEPWQPRQLNAAATPATKPPEARSADDLADGADDETRAGLASEQGAEGARSTAQDAAADSPEGRAESALSSVADDPAQALAPNESNDQDPHGASPAWPQGAAPLADDIAQADPHADAASSPDPAGDAASPQENPLLDSAAVQEACDAARREGLEQGREEGLAEGRQQALEESWQAHQLELEKAEADKAQAVQDLRAELEQEIEPLKRQLNQAAEQVQTLLGQPEKLYEHVKRLSLHLAEQLVLGELNLSPAAIERLIQRCLDELNLHGNPVVTVELNPQDKARLQERTGELSQALSVQAVASLQPGSVRVMVHDTLVEDLVEHRLDALARSLLVQPEVWREQSPFFRQPLAQRDTEVQDARPRAPAQREATPAVAPTAGVPQASGDIDRDEPLKTSAAANSPDDDAFDPNADHTHNPDSDGDSHD